MRRISLFLLISSIFFSLHVDVEGCAKYFKSSAVFVGNPYCRKIFAARAFCTWKCTEDCKMLNINRIRCVNPRILGGDGSNPDQISVSCVCIGQSTLGRRCVTNNYVWSDVEKAHQQYCRASTTNQMTSQVSSTASTAVEMRTTSTTVTSHMIYDNIPSSGNMDISILSTNSTHRDNGNMVQTNRNACAKFSYFRRTRIHGDECCNQLLPVKWFCKLKCSSDCSMLLPDSIFCPTWNASGSDALAQNILFTCQCVGSSRISLRDKCETKSYSWLDVENAYYQFCES